MASRACVRVHACVRAPALLFSEPSPLRLGRNCMPMQHKTGRGRQGISKLSHYQIFASAHCDRRKRNPPQSSCSNLARLCLANERCHFGPPSQQSRRRAFLATVPMTQREGRQDAFLRKRLRPPLHAPSAPRISPRLASPPSSRSAAPTLPSRSIHRACLDARDVFQLRRRPSPPNSPRSLTQNIHENPRSRRETKRRTRPCARARHEAWARRRVL